MRFWRARAEPPRPTVYVGDYTHKLSRIAAVAHDDDNERQCREDKEYGKRLFGQSPVPLPRLLSGAKKRS
jgi:hypothetical protein